MVSPDHWMSPKEAKQLAYKYCGRVNDKWIQFYGHVYLQPELDLDHKIVKLKRKSNSMNWTPATFAVIFPNGKLITWANWKPGVDGDDLKYLHFDLTIPRHFRTAVDRADPQGSFLSLYNISKALHKKPPTGEQMTLAELLNHPPVIPPKVGEQIMGFTTQGLPVYTYVNSGMLTEPPEPPVIKKSEPTEWQNIGYLKGGTVPFTPLEDVIVSGTVKINNDIHPIEASQGEVFIKKLDGLYSGVMDSKGYIHPKYLS